MIAKTPEMMGNLMIAGAAVAFLLSTIMATVVFDAPSANTTVAIQEIELGLQLMAAEQHIEIWMQAVLPLHIITDVVNISKIDSDGNAEPGDITDLFPVSGPATGKGTIVFKIAVLEESLMPNLDNLSHTVIPMAYVKESTLSQFVRSNLKFQAVLLRNFTMIGWMVFIIALGMVGGGAALVFMARKNKQIPAADPIN